MTEWPVRQMAEWPLNDRIAGPPNCQILDSMNNRVSVILKGWMADPTKSLNDRLSVLPYGRMTNPVIGRISNSLNDRLSALPNRNIADPPIGRVADLLTVCQLCRLAQWSIGRLVVANLLNDRWPAFPSSEWSIRAMIAGSKIHWMNDCLLFRMGGGKLSQNSPPPTPLATEGISS